MASNFLFHIPTKVVFGKGTVDQVGKLVKEQGGSNVLIHYGGRSALRSGLIDRIKTVLDGEGISHTELGGVVPNPRLSKVYEGIELCKNNNIDFILAVGGGSVIDSAKAIAYGLANEGDVWDLFMKRKTAKAFFPVGVVLTIPASGSEMSNSCVISKEDEALKRSYNDNIARPKFAVMDPVLTETLPDYQTQSGAVDIMMHTLERYLTAGEHMELTDEIAEGLLRTVMRNAQILHSDPLNYNARAEMMWAGSLSHNDLTGCGIEKGDFVSHGLEHELGAMFDVTHGAGLAAVWPSWARYVCDAILPRFVRLAVNVMGVEKCADDAETAEKGIQAMEEFFHSIDMPVNIRELGYELTDEQVRTLGANAAEAAGGKKGSAKLLDVEDMTKIFAMAR